MRSHAISCWAACKRSAMSLRRSLAIVAAVAVLATVVTIHAQAPQAPAGAGAAAAQAPPQGAPSRPSHDKKASEVYHNIKVLSDLPSDELLDNMRYFGAALGSECELCHVRKEGHLVPELDDKKEKQT